MFKKYLLLIVIVPILFLSACSQEKTYSSTPEAAPVLGSEEASNEVRDVRIIFKTSRGDIEAILFATKTPVTAANFLNLAQRDYYDGLTFHRVVSDFMVQAGDPEGTGRGGPGYQFEDEFHRSLGHYREGILSMANSGPNSNGSQFFITHNETPFLDDKHTVFGQVLKGQKVVDRIRKGDTIKDIVVLGSTAKLFEEKQARIQQWNQILDQRGL